MQIARLLTAGFEGTSPPGDLLSLLEAGLGGVILFQRNIESPEQLLRLIITLKRAAGDHPLVISIDQEGGRVARLKGHPWATIPPMRIFGEAENSESRVRALASLLARELRAVGIDLDFAPVLDVDTNPANPVIGDRSFSRDPQVVAALGAAFIEEMQRSGVAACGKHFPGHGDTDLDSHLALPRVSRSRERLDAVELTPFRAAVRSGVAAVMTAHVVCDALDPELPATLSPAALRVLREDLGFDGVIVSDDLEMRAVADRWTVGESAALALAAGCDHLLVCRRLDLARQALRGIGAALDSGRLEAGRVTEAIGRWDALAARYARPAPGTEGLAWLASGGHAARQSEVMEGLAEISSS